MHESIEVTRFCHLEADMGALAEIHPGDPVNAFRNYPESFVDA